MDTVAATNRSEPMVVPAARTIVDVFRRQVRDRGPHPALRRHVDGTWQAVDWTTYGQMVGQVTAGLAALGIERGDRVGIFSQNRVEWHVADVGVISAGAVTVPVYPTSAASQAAYVLRHSGARLCFVENEEQLAKIVDHRDDTESLERVVLFTAGDTRVDDPFVMTFDELLDIGREQLRREPKLVDERAAALRDTDLVTLVYTSGTTGPPKGAMLSHQNLMATVDAITRVITIGPDDRFISYLPLSHVAERVVSHFGQIIAGGETWFARGFATLPEDLVVCRPTIFFAVPRVWEKFHDAVLHRLESQRGVTRLLAERYFALAPGFVDEHQHGRLQPVPMKAAYLLLDRIVGAKIRHALGLDKARIVVSAAAPIHPDLLRWLHGLGLHVAEVYGQTEDCGPTTMNPPDAIRIGTVGPPLPGVEVRVADDGEILVKGPNVCRGYFDNEQGTRELLDRDGWMHSGDVGHFDDRGYLVITDRKKDLIITAHGKNIAPQEIEIRLGYESLISQAVVIGDRRPYLVALLTLDADAMATWCEERGKSCELEALAWDPDVHDEVRRIVERVNSQLSHVESIRKWRILPRDFTIAAGEITPTLKVKRAVIEERYADVISELYAAM
jgi:long-chain acyl-CoA synthetase